jgi:hypothetical protein
MEELVMRTPLQSWQYLCLSKENMNPMLLRAIMEQIYNQQSKSFLLISIDLKGGEKRTNKGQTVHLKYLLKDFHASNKKQCRMRC